LKIAKHGFPVCTGFQFGNSLVPKANSKRKTKKRKKKRGREGEERRGEITNNNENKIRDQFENQILGR